MVMTDSEKIDYLSGQLSGLRAVVYSLIETHPSPLRLQAVFERKLQVVLAASIPTRVTEVYLDGMHAETDSVLSQLAKGL